MVSKMRGEIPYWALGNVPYSHAGLYGVPDSVTSGAGYGGIGRLGYSWERTLDNCVSFRYKWQEVRMRRNLG